MKNLPFPKYRYKGPGPVCEYQLGRDLYVDQWIIPEGTKVRLTTTRNFGFMILPKDCKDKRGFIIPKRLFKY